ncbi:Tas retrotransposon peptidase A16 superfamily [Trichuris trichiura]|uniref:Tas retrotransposon peptidase A16 superfamily n=1 Tax=Trichuris trichiura TaxID=36087 RepID=A0A077ZCT2_TRITR|nr:Tas retrotransposon peptidase A16 superfamily [Trichuris trichiura]
MTAQGTLKSASGGRSNVTVLLDVGSQRSFIRKDITERLRLEGHSEKRSDTYESIGRNHASQQCGVAFDRERYTVSQPWKTEDLFLPDNYHMALQRLKQTETRLSRGASLNTAHREEMNKYIRNGRVEKTNRKGLEGRTWCLPHHMVVRHDKTKNHEEVHDILNNMYVGDFITSCNTVEDARRIVKNTSHLLQTAGFRLTKWSGNVQESLEGLARADVQC